MTIINLGDGNSVLNQYIAEIRDKDIQKNHMRFRRNLERIGEIFAYEISRHLQYTQKEVTTPLGIARCSVPLHNGMLNIFDNAQNAFIAAYRKYGKDNKFTINVEYCTSPSIEGKVLILSDTMLATGASAVLAYRRMLEQGTPVSTHFVCPIASCYGVEYLSKNLPHKNVTLWTGAIDEELTNKSYIVPGLGDAGDLAYGDKL